MSMRTIENTCMIVSERSTITGGEIGDSHEVQGTDVHGDHRGLDQNGQQEESHVRR